MARTRRGARQRRKATGCGTCASPFFLCSRSQTRAAPSTLDCLQQGKGAARAGLRAGWQQRRGAVGACAANHREGGEPRQWRRKQPRAGKRRAARSAKPAWLEREKGGDCRPLFLCTTTSGFVSVLVFQKRNPRSLPRQKRGPCGSGVLGFRGSGSSGSVPRFRGALFRGALFRGSLFSGSVNATVSPSSCRPRSSRARSHPRATGDRGGRTR